MAKFSNQEKVYSALIASYWKSILKDSFEKDQVKVVFENSKIQRLKNGTLLIIISDSMVASEVHIKGTKIIQNINNKLQKKIVKKIQIVVKNN